MNWMKFLFVDLYSIGICLIAVCIVIFSNWTTSIKLRGFAFYTTILSVVITCLICLYTISTRERIGASCEDGWHSDSVGSGTCSSHGGVDVWLYKYWFD